MVREKIALFGVLVLSVFGLSVFLLLKMNPELPVQATATSPAPPPVLEHYEALLPGGAKVELVGLALMQKQPEHWWKPDGRPLSPSPILDAAQESVQSVSEVDLRLALIHVQGIEDYNAVTANMSGSRVTVKPESGEPYVSFAGGVQIPVGKAETEIRVGVATEPLSPTRILDADGRRRPAAADAPPDPIAEDILVIQVVPRERSLPAPSSATGPPVETELKYEIPARWRQPELHMVAIDKAGVSHHASGSGGSFPSDANSRSAGMATGILLFPLSPTQIDRFEYQFRLYRYWVTFGNISVQTNQLTHVKITVDPERNVTLP